MKHHLKFKSLLRTIISGVLAAALTVSPTSALTNAEWTMFDVNGIYFGIHPATIFAPLAQVATTATPRPVLAALMLVLLIPITILPLN